jgi:hypothetical protein
VVGAGIVPTVASTSLPPPTRTGGGLGRVSLRTCYDPWLLPKQISKRGFLGEDPEQRRVQGEKNGPTLYKTTRGVVFLLGVAVDIN